METLFEVLESVGHLSLKDRELIANKIEKSKATKGQLLFKANSLVTRFYFLIKGVIRISVRE
jgi:hypothetical protein